MNILNLNKRGNLKLPREAVAHLNGAEFVQLRLTATGLTLTPIQISGVGTLKAIPQAPIEPLSDKPIQN